jgi:hypothetical protein
LARIVDVRIVNDIDADNRMVAELLAGRMK